MTIQAARLALSADMVHALGKGMPQALEQSIRAGEKTPSLHDRAEMMRIGARLAACLDEGAQRMTCIAIALVGQDDEEPASRSEKARHANQAALEVGDEEEHVQRQA
jgi:hypothetical protein